MASHFQGAAPEDIAHEQRKMRELAAEAAEYGDVYTAANVREILRLVGLVSHYD